MKCTGETCRINHNGDVNTKNFNMNAREYDIMGRKICAAF
jgi:hypothetical protein